MEDPLALDRETMRATGYRMVDLLVEGVAGVRDWPALKRASPAEIAGSWMESSGPSQVELQVLDWFKAWIGYPASASGILLSGGSGANMTALACARETLAGAMSDDFVVYVSDQAHSSLARAARTLGFRPQQVTVLPVDADHRMRPDLLAGAMAADVAAGRRPLFVAASAGSTNTGAVDPLAELSEVARRQGVAARRRRVRRLRRAHRAGARAAGGWWRGWSARTP